jgi:hypothetical protein
MKKSKRTITIEKILNEVYDHTMIEFDPQIAKFETIKSAKYSIVKSVITEFKQALIKRAHNIWIIEMEKVICPDSVRGYCKIVKRI